MKTLRLTAPAKINLRLEITSRRADGYHDIATVFHKISLCDELTLTEAPGADITITCDSPDIPVDSTNTVHKAASLLLSELNCRSGLAVRLIKRIPAGAGLGGGSSDAAATLMGLCRLLHVQPPADTLHRLAVRIGADVPFFLLPATTAFATGTGDILHPLRLTGRLWLIIIFPGICVSTAWAYRTFSQYNLLTNIPENSNFFNSIRDLDEYVPLLYNDFERIVFPAYPAVQAAKDMLVAAGAAGALMSGSGSAVFGIFSSRGARDAALRALPGRNGFAYFATHSA